jgi:DNA primase
VTSAEKTLAEMKDAILRAQDRALEARVDRFAAAARSLFRTGRGRSRRPDRRAQVPVGLSEGARDATVKFADLWAQTRDQTARAEYESLLTDLETTFAQRSQMLIEQPQRPRRRDRGAARPAEIRNPVRGVRRPNVRPR